MIAGLRIAVTSLALALGLSFGFACGGGGGADDDGGDALPAGACRSAADCIDESSCNGLEGCEGGRCAAGSPVDCDDGLACTTDGCFEPDGECGHTRDNALCEGGATCTATSGDGCETGCSATPCRAILPQCGCAAGEACYVGPGGVPRCVAEGVFAPGASCSGAFSCRRGYQCVTTGSVKRCVKLCESDADCGGGASICFSKLLEGTTVIARTCTTGCDLGDPDACPAGLECALMYDQPTRLRSGTDCTADPGDAALGEPCREEVDCAETLACFSPDAATGAGAVCAARCTFPSGIERCAPGEGCFSYEPPIVVEGVEHGICGHIED